MLEVTTVWHKMGQTSYVTEVELRCFRFCFPHSFPVTTSLDNKHGRLRLQSKGHRQRKSAQFARLPGDLAITGEREFQQKRRDGELCSDSSPDQRANYPSSMAGWCVRGALPGEHPEPVGRLRTNRPPTSTPTTKRQSRLSLGQFNSTGLGSTCPRDGADDDGINSLLRAMPQGQSVCFNAADIRGCQPSERCHTGFWHTLDGGPEMRAHRTSHMPPCGRLSGMQSRCSSQALSTSQRLARPCRPALHVARPATAAALEMQHHCQKDAAQACPCHG